jgi:hypothetical protein
MAFKAIKKTFYITSGPRINVFPPGASGCGRPLKYFKVGKTLFG